MSSKHSKITTMVERQTRFVMLVSMPADDSKSIVHALARTVQKLPAELRRSLTWERGSEMLRTNGLHGGDGRPSHPLRSAQSLATRHNENTNGLFQQYFPKGTELSRYSQPHLDKVARELNERPRETLGSRTPAAKLEEALR